MTLEDQMLFEEYQKDRKRFNEEYSEQKKFTAQGNHSGEQHSEFALS